MASSASAALHSRTRCLSFKNWWTTCCIVLFVSGSYGVEVKFGSLQASTREGKNQVANYARRLLQCQQTKGRWSQGDGTQMAWCLKDILLSASDLVRDPRGLPELGLPQIDPFHIERMVIDGNTGLRGNFTDLKLYGIANGLSPENLHIRFNPRNLTANLIIGIPGFKLDGEFETSIDFIRTLFPWAQGFQATSSAGRITAVFDKVEARCVGIFKEAPGTTGLGMRLKRIGSDFDFNEADFQLESKDPKDPLVPLIQAILKDKESAKVIINELKPEVIQIVNKLLFKIMANGIANLEKILFAGNAPSA